MFLQKLRKFTSLSLVLCFSISAFATPQRPLPPKRPIIVAVIDWPTDPTHPMIEPYLLAAQKSNAPVNSQEPVSMFAASNQRLQEMILKKMDLGEGSDGLQAYQELVREAGLTDQRAQPQKAPRYFKSFRIAKQILKAVRDARSGKTAKMSALSLYLHGSHVDSLAVLGEDPTQVKLIHIPVPPALVSEGMGVKSDASSEEFRESIATWVGRVTTVLKTYDVKAVNLSSGLFSTAVLEKLKEQLPVLEESLARLGDSRFKSVKALGEKISGEIQKLTTQIEVMERKYSLGMEEYRKLFIDNPEVQFFMAAGNSSLETEDTARWDLTRIALPNLAQVAATDFTGELASFSNRSRAEIEYGAPGVDILGALAHGGQVRMSGTSMASPLALRSYVQVFKYRPKVSRAEALALFTQHLTVARNELNEHVIGGRFVLPSDGAQDWSELGCPEAFAELK